MSYMILRRANSESETGHIGMESALLDAAFAPSAQAVRLSIRNGQVAITHGPFEDTVAGFTMVDAPTIEDAVQWLERWPASDDEITLEVRQRGCPDNCPAIDLGGDAQGNHYAVLLRSNTALETEVPVDPAKITALNAHNEQEAKAGTLLAGDGLRGTAKGARVKVAKSGMTVIDGPFTEIKELIAGFWLIRAADMDEAIAWASRNPYPTGPEVEVEIRPVQHASSFSGAMASEEARMRSEQLDAGMRAHFTA